MSWVGSGSGAAGDQARGELRASEVRFLSSKLVVENVLHMPCCLHRQAGKNGIICFTSVINHIANCVGDQTVILCRKLLFIFYLTKLKAETVLHCALLWF